MNVTRDNVKDVTGFVSSFGGGALTTYATTGLIRAIPNPIMRVAAWVGSVGIGIMVGKTAKQGTDELIDAVADIVGEIKKR